MRAVWWGLAICVWLASAVLSLWLGSTLFAFGVLDLPTLQVRILLWAPVIAIAVLAFAFAARRKDRWLPAILLLSPALQVAGLMLANLDPVI